MFGFVKTLGFVYLRMCNDLRATTNYGLDVCIGRVGGEREIIMDEGEGDC